MSLICISDVYTKEMHIYISEIIMQFIFVACLESAILLSNANSAID